jgi:hypothetical protein
MLYVVLIILGSAFVRGSEGDEDKGGCPKLHPSRPLRPCLPPTTTTPRFDSSAYAA